MFSVDNAKQQKTSLRGGFLFVCMLFTSRASIGILSFMTEIQRNLAVGIGIAALLGAGVYYYATRSPLPAPGGQTATSTPTIGGVGANGECRGAERENKTLKSTHTFIS